MGKWAPNSPRAANSGPSMPRTGHFAPLQPLDPAVNRPNASDLGPRNPRAQNHPTMWGQATGL